MDHGTPSEVLNDPEGDDARTDYAWGTLQNDGPVVDAMSRIRQVYPNALHVEHPRPAHESTFDASAQDLQARSTEEIVEQFVDHVTDRDGLSDAHRAILADALDQLHEEERTA